MIKSLIFGSHAADVRLVGFDEESEVDLSSEFSGETQVLTDAAADSMGVVVVRGLHFRFKDLSRYSVVVFKDGFLLDVAECNLHESAADSELKVYSFRSVNFGLIVDDDIDSEIIWRQLSEKSDGIVAVVRSVDDSRYRRIEKLQEYFGIPALVCCGDKLHCFGTKPLMSVSDPTR